MPITDLLERNAREYANDICLVEINPEVRGSPPRHLEGIRTYGAKSHDPLQT